MPSVGDPLAHNFGSKGRHRGERADEGESGVFERDRDYFSIRFAKNELHYKIEINAGKAERPIFQSLFFESTLNFGQNVGSEVWVFPADEFVGVYARVFLQPSSAGQKTT